MELQDIAQKIVSNPKLRGDYFENPDKVLAREVPREGLIARVTPGVADKTSDLRAELAGALEEEISKDTRLISFRGAFAEKELFLKDALQNPQKSFQAVFLMSIATFVVGLIFVAGAFVAAWQGTDTLQKAIIGGLSGGAGLVGTLGTVLAIARDTIRQMNGENAQIRMILTDYATETTHLRALPITGLQDATATNEQLRAVTVNMVELIQQYAKPAK